MQSSPRYIFLSFFLLVNACIYAQSFLKSAQAQSNEPRLILNLDNDWQFLKAERMTKTSSWKAIHLPHTWNVDDVMDDEPGYYRGVGWYKKKLTIGSELAAKELSLYLEGANQETEIFVNGKKAGEHVGGYTAFSVPITSLVKFGSTNELLIKVNNRHNKNIPPLSADFTFYGGIYRDFYLFATNKTHFSSDAGANAVYISTPAVSKEKASVQIKSLLSNASTASANVFVVSTIRDKEGKIVATKKSAISLKPGLQRTAITQNFDEILQPILWSPEYPYLYAVETRLEDKNGKLLDRITNPLGFRWFQFDADKGFFLNGSPYKLVGASRHQDFKGLGNAVPNEIAVNDVALLKKMGGNFLRVAHYPQDPVVLNACDSLGLLASVEIPIVNEITETDSFYRHCEQMQVEMIHQNFNHPSVIMWCYMNEVLLKPQFTNDKERQKIYFENIRSLALRLETLTRKEDPLRVTMMANHGSLEQYRKVGLLSIPMVVGWNLYSGWYGGVLEDFPKFLDEFHKAYPDRPFMVTEYGSDADPRIHSLQPVRFDKSVEYTTRFHQYYLTEMMKRSYVAGAIIWNLADFNSETRAETMPHINNKGLLEWDRTPKDAFYYYQAVLSRKPFLKILSTTEAGYAKFDSVTASCYKPVQVATNADSVIIDLNGKLLKAAVENGLAEANLAFKEGSNTIIAEAYCKGKLVRDSVTTTVHLHSSCIDGKAAFQPINILLGSTRYYVDKKGQWWQPDHAYTKGSWGSIGGNKFRMENNTRLPYGTDKNIIGTDDDPVYQTQQTGIRQYRLDLPPGRYEVVLHFAELAGGKPYPLPYNLSDDKESEPHPRRIFTVRINGKIFLKQFTIAKDYGFSKAVVKSAQVVVAASEPVLIDFEPVEGEPVLNALQIKKLAGESARN